MAGKSYISIQDAADKLGVSETTIRKWIKRKHLPAKRKRVTMTKYLIDPEDLDSVYTVTCEWCGKEFTSQRPLRARFCCLRHGTEHEMARKRKATAEKRDRKSSEPSES